MPLNHAFSMPIIPVPVKMTPATKMMIVRIKQNTSGSGIIFSAAN
jgi:hypothetical protein